MKTPFATFLKPIWHALLIALCAGGIVMKAAATEYVFSEPNTPVLWDFSGAYPPPLSMTLNQKADGSLVADTGASGRVTGDNASFGLNLSSVSNPDYWYYVDATTKAYVFSQRCTASLVLDRPNRLLTGQRECTTVSQRYAFFLFTWAPFRELTSEFWSKPLSVPLPEGVDGHWKLSLNPVSNGRQISGMASVTLASSNPIPFQITGTNETATRSVLTLHGVDNPNTLTVVTLGPEKALHSLHGNIAGQPVDYDAPASGSVLTIHVSGSGAVKPLTDGQTLLVGKDYTLTATPRAGNLFSNWVVAGIIVTNPTLRFSMISNLVVTANFVTNCFIPAAGVYSGLFYETNGVRWQSSGFLTLTLASSGAFSGKLSIQGGTHSFSGRFDIDGQSSVSVRRSGKPALTVFLQLDALEREISGMVSDGGWLADLAAPHAYSSAGNPVQNYLGVYTMVFPGGNSGGGFLGDGCATFWIDYYGTIHLSGDLADGTTVSQSARVSRDGQWPLYLPLYRSKGAILGWITLSKTPASSLGGDLIWFKPASPKVRFYAGGFTNQMVATGGSFFTPNWVRSGKHSFTNGVLVLTGGNLPVALTNTFNGSTPAVNAGASLKWDAVSGAVSGSFIHPVTARRVSLKGVLLQNEGVARGFFPGTNQSGSFIFQQ